MLSTLTLTAMLFLADDGWVLYGGEYAEFKLCSAALNDVHRDAVCVSGESVLAPAVSLIPKANPFLGGSDALHL